MPRFFILVLCALLTVPATAQVYRHVDEEGNVTFSDMPSEDSEAIDIPQTNTTAPPPVMPRPAPKPKPDSAGGSSYAVEITAPANETIIPNGPGNFSVSASVKPKLGNGDQLQLKIDGAAHGEPQAGGSWALTNIFRGEHNLTVAVIDKEGKELATSAPVTVFVFRPSSNNRNNRPRPSNPIVRPPRPTPR